MIGPLHRLKRSLHYRTQFDTIQIVCIFVEVYCVTSHKISPNISPNISHCTYSQNAQNALLHLKSLTTYMDCCSGQLWPHVSTAATGIVREQIDPLMAQNKPKWISDINLHNFNLGEEPPSISGVKVCSQSFHCSTLQSSHTQYNMPIFRPQCHFRLCKASTPSTSC